MRGVVLFALLAAAMPTKSQLLDSTAILQQRADSLSAEIEKLRKTIALKDSIILSFINPAVTEIRASDPADIRYDESRSDSLMSVWMESRKNVYFSSDENIDSEHFSSKVSDEEMMRRLKAMNPYITLPFNQTVRNYMVLYAERNPAGMARILGLSAYYMPIIESILDKYELPLELKYLAVVESRLNPRAHSRAGAKGLWQFMYNTAKIYGLKINSFIDERLDVERATDAAARYLADAYKVFGDWNLAISSYNCGAGNVQKAIRLAGSRNFWDIYPYLPRETRGYVPAFVGVMYAVNYSREYGIVPDRVGLPAVTDTFHIRKNLHFKQINEVVGVPMDVLSELNPQYTHNIIPGEDGPQILELPFSWVDKFVSTDKSVLYGHKADTLLSQQVMKNIKESGGETRIGYKVKSGDNLGKIAARYHVSVNQLMKWNHLRSTNIRVGQMVYIYK